MPKTAEHSKEILDTIIRQKRVETSKKSSDILAYLGSLGADWDRVKNDFVQTILDGLNAYNQALFCQFSELTPKLDSAAYKKLKGKLEAKTLKHSDIKKYANLTNTQQLFLHQIINNNRILNDISLSKSLLKDFPDLNSALNLIQDFYHYDDISHYFVDVQINDPNSFRLFQLLNNYALTTFTRVLYSGTLGGNEARLSETIKGWIKKGIDALKSSDASRNRHSVEGFQEQLSKNILSAVKSVFKSSEDEHNEIVDIVTKLIPSMLQISFDQTNFASLKIRIQELLDLEKLVPGFKLTTEFLESYINACYPLPKSDLSKSCKKTRLEHKKSQEKILKDRQDTLTDITGYINDGRKLRSQADRTVRAIRHGESPTKPPEIEEFKKLKNHLSLIEEEVRNLWLRELCTSRLLPLEKQALLKPILLKLSAAAVIKLIDILADSAEGIKRHKPKIEDFLKAYGLEKNADLLFELFKIKFDEQHTTLRAQYYHNLLQQVSQRLRDKENEAVKYLSSISDHANVVLQNADVFDDQLLDGDYLSIMLSKFYNPLEGKLKKYMPSNTQGALQNLFAIEKEVAYISKILDESKKIRALSIGDSKVNDSYDNLESLRKSLLKKHDILASNLIDLLNEEITASLKQQTNLIRADYDKQVNRWFAPISVDKRKRLDGLLEQATEKLSNQLEVLKNDIISFQEAVNTSVGEEKIAFYLKQNAKLREQFFRLELLINQLEKENLQSRYKFDFSAVKDRLQSLKKYYDSSFSQRARIVGALKQDNKLELKSKRSSLKSLIGYLWWLVRTSKWLIGVYRAISGCIRWAISALFTLYTKTAGIFIFTVIRYLSNKGGLFERLDSLIDQVNKLHSAKIKIISDRKYTDPDNKPLRDTINQLAALKNKIESAKEHAQHLFTNTSQIMAEYNKLLKELHTIQFESLYYKNFHLVLENIDDNKGVVMISVKSSEISKLLDEEKTLRGSIKAIIDGDYGFDSDEQARKFDALLGAYQEVMEKLGLINAEINEKIKLDEGGSSDPDSGRVSPCISSHGSSPTAAKTPIEESSKSAVEMIDDLISQVLAAISGTKKPESDVRTFITRNMQRKCFENFLAESKTSIPGKADSLSKLIDDKLAELSNRQEELASGPQNIVVAQKMQRINLQLKVLNKLKADIKFLQDSTEYKDVLKQLSKASDRTITAEQLKPVDDIYDTFKSIEDKIGIVVGIDSVTNPVLQDILNIVLGGDENSPLEALLTDKAASSSAAPALYRNFIDLVIKASSNGIINYRELFTDILIKISKNPKAIEELTPVAIFKGAQSKIIIDAVNHALLELDKTDGTPDEDNASLINALGALRQVLGSSTISKVMNVIKAVVMKESLATTVTIGAAGFSASVVGGVVGLACGSVSKVVGTAWNCLSTFRRAEQAEQPDARPAASTIAGLTL